MDFPRGLAIALPPPSAEFHQRSRRSPSSPHARSISNSHPSEFGRAASSMAIPGRRMDDVPPALPPPRYIQGLDDGVDIAWRQQNQFSPARPQTLPPIRPGSSLLGHALLPSQLDRDDNIDLTDADDDNAMDLDLEMESEPASRTVSAPSPSLSQITSRAALPTLSRRSSGINQSLHGENPLAQQNHHQSTHAYDKRLLMKIGKTNSPPNHSKSPSADLTSSDTKLSIQTRGPLLLGRPAPDGTSILDPITKWLPSPASAISPSTHHDWRDYSLGPQSPLDGSAHPLHLDSEYLLPVTSRHNMQRRKISRSSPDDTRTRSERGSYDSSMFADHESTGDDVSSTTQSISERPLPEAHHGVKRRALSPPPESSQAQRQDLPPPPRVHNIIAQQQSLRSGSLSSTASSLNYPSHASSTYVSSASSMTSMSSLDTTGVRDSRNLYTSPQSATSPGVAILPLRKPPEIPPATKPLVQTSHEESRSPLTKIGNYYICACCPKKPKKFESEEQLRAHENEKQYTCAYCPNRFKNKNEAERHQNSLHLRKQSWSCASISTVQAAFHPTSHSSFRGIASDTCGFCGDEFSNQPPNWEDRAEHLMNVHKFGECNSSKKFYRADHFRQHLKHSHAGKSGKWTNILENNCLREEALSEATSQSPTASEHSTSGSANRLQGSTLANPGDAALIGVETIDEVHEEY